VAILIQQVNKELLKTAIYEGYDIDYVNNEITLYEKLVNFDEEFNNNVIISKCDYLSSYNPQNYYCEIVINDYKKIYRHYGFYGCDNNEPGNEF
jgi:hypothetical protein